MLGVGVGEVGLVEMLVGPLGVGVGVTQTAPLSSPLVEQGAVVAG